MRASKLRLPDSTAAHTRSLSVISLLNSGARSPALPMQVVQPYAATAKPSCSRYGSRPALVRYSVTMREPGASDVFTWPGTLRPACTAFLASRPAASSTPGLLVLVQLVIAAISTSPLRKVRPLSAVKVRVSLSALWLKPLSATVLLNSDLNWLVRCVISMRSCGRLGPARLGATVDRSSLTTLE